MPSGIYTRSQEHIEKCNKYLTPFKKGHKFFGDLSKPNYFQEGDKLNEKHPLWKGDDVSLSGLHHWVERNLGKPDTCEDCGKKGLTGCQIHWANKDHTYKRNLTDWLRLCAKCHREYDIKYNNLIINYKRK